MSEHETPSPTEPALSRRDKEQLLQKMYGLPHWIAIIRLFSYQTLAMDKARVAIKPIAEEFGKEKTADACEILVEIVPGKEPLARLKAHIRRMAFQILGAEELSVPESTKTPAPLPQPEKPKKRPAQREVPPANTERAVKQPRHLVLNRYEAWLKEIGLAFVAVKDVGRTTPAVKPFVAGLDFIVLREEAKLLVTLRPHLQAKHLKAIGELKKLFGSEYRPVRVWPTDGPDGWNWQEHAIDISSAGDPID
jgi:hypothetical protein